MRIGLFGGTFDPVHYGHLLAAEQCREQFALDEVWLVPAAAPPHKSTVSISSGDVRAEMLELAVAGNRSYRVSRIELDRTGPSYTVDTLAAVRAERPDDELFLIVGADSLREFATWREPRRILEMATMLVVNRGGCDSDPGEEMAALQAELGGRIEVVDMPGIELSASDLRARVRTGRSLRFMTPRAVEEYIKSHAVYASGTG